MGYNNLTNSNRIRHAVFIKLLLSTALKDIKLGHRLGTRRSMDGLIFDIGDGKVIKIIFSGRGAMNNMNSVRNEYAIAKKMSEAGVGPKVYDMFEFAVPNILDAKNAVVWPSSNAALKAKLKNHGFTSNKAAGFIANVRKENPRSVNLNLFQNWFMMNNKNYNRIKTGCAIVMENLKNAVDLNTYMKTKPFPGNELIALVEKMHNAGVAHGDLHMGNIMVQKKPSGGIRLVIIDFGRSVNMAKNKIRFNYAIASNIRNLKSVVSSNKSGPAFPKK